MNTGTSNYVMLVVLGLITLFTMIAASYARDLAYQVQMIILMILAGGLFLVTLRSIGEPITPIPIG